jgi:hypothetical protein
MIESVVSELGQVLTRLQQTAAGYVALVCKGADVLRGQRDGDAGSDTPSGAGASADTKPEAPSPSLSTDDDPARDVDEQPSDEVLSAPDRAGASGPANGNPANGNPAGAADLPIIDYDLLAASQVVERLNGCGPSELEAIRAYETDHRHRRTILNRVDQLLSGSAG